MMIYKKLKIAFIFLMICMIQINVIQAQDKKLDKANAAYDNFAFVEAAKLYNKEIKKGNTTVEAYTKLANSYYYNGNYSEAAECYAKVIDTKDLDPECYFRYAQALNNSKRFKDAEDVMKMYYSKYSTKNLSGEWNEQKLLESINKQSGRYTIKEAEINSSSSDFGTAFYDKNKVIFASARDTASILKRKHIWNEKSFLKLYSADMTVDGGLANAVALKGDVNTRYHQSSPAITKDGKTMFFTRNNFYEGKLGKDKLGTNNLKIYSAQNVKGEWKNVKQLPFPINGDAFSSAHPALNADETQLYFVSDRNNSFGNSDIYVVSLNKGGYIGNDVTKLSDEINTLGRETFPYIDASGVLYFSSDGHPGLGGLDVFAAIKDEFGKYHVVNLGDGVNTSADDFAYVIQDETRKGFFSSNRNGSDDIFGFTENKPIDFGFSINPVVYGNLSYYGTKKPIEGIAVETYNVADEKINTVYSDKDGNYSVSLNPYVTHKLIYKKNGLAEITELIPALKLSERKESSHEFFNEMDVLVDNKTVTLVPGNDLTNVLKLKPIYFDYSGYKIRESSKTELDIIVTIMKDRPKLTLEINSHTDSRGRDDFNMKLSENRAKATMEYIVAHGISADRISAHGFGETRLINKCSNGVKCTEKEHEMNRRSEFIIGVRN